MGYDWDMDETRVCVSLYMGALIRERLYGSFYMGAYIWGSNQHGAGNSQHTEAFIWELVYASVYMGASMWELLRGSFYMGLYVDCMLTVC